MGKGDVKTRRGKIVRGTFGKTRRRKKDGKAVASRARSAKKK